MNRQIRLPIGLCCNCHVIMTMMRLPACLPSCLALLLPLPLPQPSHGQRNYVSKFKYLAAAAAAVACHW